MVQVIAAFLITFLRKTMNLEAPGHPCTRLEHGLASGVKKTTLRSRILTHFGALFRTIRDFLSFVFSFIFDVTSDSELYALWWPKGTQKEVFEEPFRRDFEVSDESKNEAPV